MPGGADVPQFDVQQTDNETTLTVRGSLDINTAPQLAEEIDRDRRRQAEQACIVDLAALDLIDSSGVAALVKLYKGVRGVGGTRHDHRRARSAARDLQAAAHGQGLQSLVPPAARPRDHEDLPERRRAALGAVQSPAVRRARELLRARGDGHDPVVPGRRLCLARGRAPASSRRCHAARRSTGSTSRTRARCSCRGSRTRRGAALRGVDRAGRSRAIAARSTSCSARGPTPTASRR